MEPPRGSDGSPALGNEQGWPPPCPCLHLSRLLAFPKATGWLLEPAEPPRAELTFENEQFRNFPRCFPSRPPSYCNCSSELSSSNSVNLREIRLCFCCHF